MQYHLEELPAVFIVDPITGAKLWQRSGFVSPDTLIEELVPFLDMGEGAWGDAWAVAHTTCCQHDAYVEPTTCGGCFLRELVLTAGGRLLLNTGQVVTSCRTRAGHA